MLRPGSIAQWTLPSGMSEGEVDADQEVSSNNPQCNWNDSVRPVFLTFGVRVVCHPSSVASRKNN